MNKGCFYGLILFLVLLVGGLAYFLGKKHGTKTIDQMAMNVALIRDIAELSALEVQGTAQIKTTNILNDGSITDAFKKLFTERTLQISIPFVAKFGVDLGKQNIHIQEKDKIVSIVLPHPQLLSYELRLDRLDAMTRNGLLETSNENQYAAIQKKLYTASKNQMEQQLGYQQQAKDKIRKILENYYAPMHFKVEVTFKDEIKSRVDRPLN